MHACSIQALVKGVKKFGGGVVLVSHDQRLISAACDEILIVDDQTVERYAVGLHQSCIVLWY
jgi:ATPase subunit of ABC transporter with duplicated ATPase domains